MNPISILSLLTACGNDGQPDEPQAPQVLQETLKLEENSVLKQFESLGSECEILQGKDDTETGFECQLDNDQYIESNDSLIRSVKYDVKSDKYAFKSNYVYGGEPVFREIFTTTVLDKSKIPQDHKLNMNDHLIFNNDKAFYVTSHYIPYGRNMVSEKRGDAVVEGIQEYFDL